MTGCSPVSLACDNCYAKKQALWLKGLGQKNYRDGFAVRTHPHMLEVPLRWKRPRKVFVCSMGDLFHKQVPFEFVAATFGVMAAAAQHTFQLLTKRPERMLEFFAWLERQKPVGKPRLEVCWQALVNEVENHPEGDGGPLHTKHSADPDGPWPLPNLWLGVTTEDQERADERIPVLLKAPAVVRFISAEPLLGPLDVSKYLYVQQLDSEPPPYVADTPHLDWGICGGESGQIGGQMPPAVRSETQGQVTCRLCRHLNAPDSQALAGALKVAIQGVQRARQHQRLCRIAARRRLTGGRLWTGGGPGSGRRHRGRRRRRSGRVDNLLSRRPEQPGQARAYQEAQGGAEHGGHKHRSVLLGHNPFAGEMRA